MLNAPDFNALLANVAGRAPRNQPPPQVNTNPQPQMPVPQAQQPVVPPTQQPIAQPPGEVQPQQQSNIPPDWQQFLGEVAQDPNALGFLFAMGSSMLEPTDEPFVTQVGRSLTGGFSMMGMIANAQNARQMQEADLQMKQEQMANDRARTANDSRATDEQVRQGEFARGAGHQLEVDRLAQERQLAEQQIALQQQQISAHLSTAARAAQNEMDKLNWEKVQTFYEGAIAQFNAMSYTFQSPDEAKKAWVGIMDQVAATAQAMGVPLPKLVDEPYQMPQQSGAPATSGNQGNDVPQQPPAPPPVSTTQVPAATSAPVNTTLAPNVSPPPVISPSASGSNVPEIAKRIAKRLTANEPFADPGRLGQAINMMEAQLNANPTLQQDREFMDTLRLLRSKR